MKMRRHAFLAALAFGVLSPLLHAAPQLTPYAPLPDKAQLRWHQMEMYAFVHFTMNTFTGKEWGYGDESPDLFNPSEYNPDQIVGELAQAGFKGVVLTAKHHDGFCLWPTKTTRHSVASAKWKDGKGDVVRDFAAACRKHGVLFGIYVSPWDRNHAEYGTPNYLKAYQTQIRELLTSYGDIFIVWHDGANGGDGYYGGGREKRSIDASTYYQWPETWKLVKKLQPMACIFSDAGPDVRWVGNEHGEAGIPCWATYTPQSTVAGKAPVPGLTTAVQTGARGTVNGKYWMPAEVDVSIRPGWFWHESENGRVRTPDQLMKLYMESVGRGANLNLNVPPDRRGRLHERDVESLKGFRGLLDRLYETDYAQGATASADSSVTPASHVLDGREETFWAPQSVTGTLTVQLPGVREFDVIRLAEPIRYGQRVRRYEVFVRDSSAGEGEWKSWQRGESIGARVVMRSIPVKADELKIVLEGVRAEDSTTGRDVSPALSQIALYRFPVTYSPPRISIDTKGMMAIDHAEDTVTRYTLDGSEPSGQSPEFKNPVSLPLGGLVKAKRWHRGKEVSEASVVLPVAKAAWKVTAESAASDPASLIDGSPATLWHTHAGNGEIPPPQTIDIDMGARLPVWGIVCTPRQDGVSKGIPDQYEVYATDKPGEWGEPVAQGEFSNIKANPVPQTIDFAQSTRARYIRLVIKRVVDGNHASLAEIDVIADQSEK